MEWKNELYNYEVTPPQGVWDRIVHDLDEQFIQAKEKLYHYQVDPPPGIWDKIVHDLDEEFSEIKERLYHFEAEPPSEAWHNIQLLLEEPSVVRLPLRQRIFRIAVAAVFIGIVFLTANYFLTGTRTNNDTAAKQPASIKIPGKLTPGSAPVNENISDQPAITGKKILASRFTPVKRNNRTSTEQENSFYSDAPNYSTPSISSVYKNETAVTDRYDLNRTFNRHISNLKGEIKEDVSLYDLPNSYFLMTGPDGQSVRVSSKFRNTIQYLNGSSNEELLDVILRESQYWKNLFAEWKQKVSNSSFVPSSENFMDIAELMKLLQQNNK